MSAHAQRAPHVRVHRSVGAVAVYSRPRAVLIALLLVAVLAGGGYAIGRVTAPEATTTVIHEKAAAPPVAPATAAPTPAKASPAATRAAYRRGLRAGVARGRKSVVAAPAALAALEPGTPYIVTVNGTPKGPQTLGFNTTVESGFLYRLCPDRTGICKRPDKP
jgi:hypothetical protein